LAVDTPAQTSRRLLAALEDLAAQETTAIAAGDFVALAKLTRRAAPLVEHFATHGPAVVDASFRTRVHALLERRRQNDDALNVQLARARAELERANESERRIAQISSIYGRTGAASRQLCVVG
jgi:N-acetyl-gamma-glutamylphosphate reductase